MKKMFCLSILLFLFSCSDSSDIVEVNNNDTTPELNNVLIETKVEKLSDDSTEEDIEELIDIIFEDLLQK